MTALRPVLGSARVWGSLVYSPPGHFLSSWPFFIAFFMFFLSSLQAGCLRTTWNLAFIPTRTWMGWREAILAENKVPENVPAPGFPVRIFGRGKLFSCKKIEFSTTFLAGGCQLPQWLKDKRDGEMNNNDRVPKEPRGFIGQIWLKAGDLSAACNFVTRSRSSEPPRSPRIPGHTLPHLDYEWHMGKHAWNLVRGRFPDFRPDKIFCNELKILACYLRHFIRFWCKRRTGRFFFWQN